MKKSIFYLLCIFALTAFTTNKFIDIAKPLKDIKVSYALHREVDGKGRPAIVTRTDANGKFFLMTKEGGKFMLTVSYKEMLAKIGIIEKVNNPKGSNYKITLSINTGTISGIMIKGKKMSAGSTIDLVVESTDDTSIIEMPLGGGTLTGTITFKKSDEDAKMKEL